MINVQTKLAAEQIYLEMLECKDDCETFSLEREIVSLRRLQLFREKRNCALDSTVITL